MAKTKESLSNADRYEKLAEKFDFHYVPTSTGAISGKMLMDQTEDAINDVGKFAEGAYEAAEESVQNSDQALMVAQEAKSNSLNAIATVERAVEKVDTLETVVTNFGQQVTNAVAQAQSAVQIATEAQASANDSVKKAADAVSKAEQAISTSNEATNNSEKAKESAELAQNEATVAKDEATKAKEEAEAAKFSASQSATTANESLEQLKQVSAAAYATRVSSETLTSGQTVDIKALKPQGNVKVGDTVIDSSGQYYQIVSLEDSMATLSTEVITIGAFAMTQAMYDAFVQFNTENGVV